MADEREKKSVGADDEGKGEDEDVEAHKNSVGRTSVSKTSVGKTSVGENDEEGDDVEAHRHSVGKTSIGAADEDEKTSIG